MPTSACLCGTIRRSCASVWRRNNTQCCLSDGEAIVAGEEEMEGAAVGADPLGGDAAGFAGADVPLGRVIGGGPGSPGVGGVVDAESAGEASVFARAGLAPEVALEGCVVTDAAAVTLAGILEDAAAKIDVGGPLG